MISKDPQINTNMSKAVTTLESRPAPDFDRDILVPLREKQAIAAAAAAKAEQDRINAQIAATRDRVRPHGTYRSSYYYGQCTYYVASRINVPSNWGNAGRWIANAQAAGWQTGMVPRVGAIAATSEGYFGHVAIVEAIDGSSVLISEMNFAGIGVVSQRWASASAFAYIY